ncbi:MULTISPECIES: molybdenum cofactor guanylyltransferase [Cyanophyceae]|uniref:molybdenum cofactor guanylyltransferase n=1 Tax=Cyanophyceae TaxID=3028117 RepID=UPI001687A6FE|nr:MULTISPECIES: molybdenum cofactor guanylyltransferase [Cyanophyceae]MBD1917244.1 molybdenum cofactor guanylyltransferase [Phormidium sp. FACHB-77]MBD2030775.1 molybdenum cofactor guanylyltransferase [Phormidium sp. FACHB-322]MBD2050117.1 molybdenum cofactor guanylyltransferase [Leptolyngbya sp. FACHB-60]
MTSLATVILAGGRSSRMGHDKALIAVGEETLIQRTCRVALQCSDRVYIVTPWPDRYQPALPNTVGFIAEATSPGQAGTFQGPLMALITALSVLRTKQEDPPAWVLTLACDMPNLSAAVLATWRDELDHLEPQHLAYLPKRQQRWEPLCGFYRVTALESLKQYASTGGRSLQAWLNQQAIAPIPDIDEAMFANVNTPSDLAEWQKTKDF